VAIGYVETEGGTSTATTIIEKLKEFERNNIDLMFVPELIR
jgi:hypothetical protein